MTFESSLAWLYKEMFKGSIGSALWVFSNPVFYVGTALILLAEKKWPAKPSQKFFGVGFLQDLVWVAVQAVLQVIVISVFVQFLSFFYNRHLSFLTVHTLDTLPFALKFTIWFLIVDFSEWLHHWIRHKVPWFWEFHAVHHSQKELNLFTDLRYHGLEYIIARLIAAIPLMILNVGIYDFILFSMIHDWYTRIYHSNLKFDYGFLRYILVTPQSHRIHHSVELKHCDKNFGVIFSFWDDLFGTRYKGWNEYPDTGIHDKNFPLEQSKKLLPLILAPIQQHIYPFQKIIQSLKPVGKIK